MWRRFFGRLFRSGSSTAPPAAQPAPPDRPARPPASPSAWQRAAPLLTSVQRAGTDFVSVGRLSANLRDQHRSPAALAPLGHRVHPAQPGGIVTGLARSIAAPVPAGPAAAPSPPGPEVGDELLMHQAARGHGATPEAAGTRVADLSWPSADGPTADAPRAPTTLTGDPSRTPPLPVAAALPRIARTASPAAATRPVPRRPADLPLRRVAATAPSPRPGPAPDADRGSPSADPAPPSAPDSAAAPSDVATTAPAATADTDVPPVARAVEDPTAPTATTDPATHPGGGPPDHGASQPVPSAAGSGTAGSTTDDPSDVATPSTVGDVATGVARAADDAGVPDRPTVGMRDRPRHDALAAPPSEPASADGATLPARGRRPSSMGLGPPVSRLPDTAGPIGDRARAGRPVTGSGRRTAISQGVQRLLARPEDGSSRPVPTNTGAVPSASPGSSTPDPGTSGPDAPVVPSRPVPPVPAVARARLALAALDRPRPPATPAVEPTIEPVARSFDEAGDPPDDHPAPPVDRPGAREHAPAPAGPDMSTAHAVARATRDGVEPGPPDGDPPDAVLVGLRAPLATLPWTAPVPDHRGDAASPPADRADGTSGDRPIVSRAAVPVRWPRPPVLATSEPDRPAHRSTSHSPGAGGRPVAGAAARVPRRMDGAPHSAPDTRPRPVEPVSAQAPAPSSSPRPRATVQRVAAGAPPRQGPLDVTGPPDEAAGHAHAEPEPPPTVVVAARHVDGHQHARDTDGPGGSTPGAAGRAGHAPAQAPDQASAQAPAHTSATAPAPPVATSRSLHGPADGAMVPTNGHAPAVGQATGMVATTTRPVARTAATRPGPPPLRLSRSVEHAPAVTVSHAAEPASAPAGAGAAGAANGRATLAHDVPVARATNGSDQPVPTAADSTLSAPMARASETAESGSAEADDQSDDDQFRQLYDRIRDELRWELRTQRERAGLLSDPL